MTSSATATNPRTAPVQGAAATMRALERRQVAHLRAGRTTDFGNAPMLNSARDYTDPARFEAERREIFRKNQAGLQGMTRGS